MDNIRGWRALSWYRTIAPYFRTVIWTGIATVIVSSATGIYACFFHPSGKKWLCGDRGEGIFTLAGAIFVSVMIGLTDIAVWTAKYLVKANRRDLQFAMNTARIVNIAHAVFVVLTIVLTVLGEGSGMLLLALHGITMFKAVQYTIQQLTNND